MHVFLLAFLCHLYVYKLQEATQTLNYVEDNLLEAPTGSKKKGGQRDSMDIWINKRSSKQCLQNLCTK